MIGFRIHLPIIFTNTVIVSVGIILQMLTFIYVLDDYIPVLVWIIRVIILLTPAIIVVHRLPSERKYYIFKAKIIKQEFVNNKYRNIVRYKNKKFLVFSKKLYNEHEVNDTVRLYKLHNNKKVHYLD